MGYTGNRTIADMQQQLPLRAHHRAGPARKPCPRRRDHPRSAELPAGAVTPGSAASRAAIGLLGRRSIGRGEGAGRRHRRRIISAATASPASKDRAGDLAAISMPCCATAPRSIGGSQRAGRDLASMRASRVLRGADAGRGMAPRARSQRACDGDRFRPTPLDRAESAHAAERLPASELRHPRHAARGARQLPGLARAASRGARSARICRARWRRCNEPAPLDLRVNLAEGRSRDGARRR